MDHSLELDSTCIRDINRHGWLHGTVAVFLQQRLIAIIMDVYAMTKQTATQLSWDLGDQLCDDSPTLWWPGIQRIHEINPKVLIFSPVKISQPITYSLPQSEVFELYTVYRYTVTDHCLMTAHDHTAFQNDPMGLEHNLTSRNVSKSIGVKRIVRISSQQSATLEMRPPASWKSLAEITGKEWLIKFQYDQI